MLRLACTLLLASGIAPVTAQPWLVVEDDGQLLRLGAAPVEWAGVGHIAFGEDRRRVRVEGEAPVRVTVDGEPIRGRRAVTAAVPVEVRTADGGRWTLRPVQASALEAAGVRIRDDRPAGEARVDTDEPMRFYVHATDAGGWLFLQPD